MQISIRPSYGKTFTLEVGASDTIRSGQREGPREDKHFSRHYETNDFGKDITR